MDIGKFFSQNQTESLVNFGVQIRGLILHNVKVILNLLGKKKYVLNATKRVYVRLNNLECLFLLRVTKI